MDRSSNLWDFSISEFLQMVVNVNFLIKPCSGEGKLNAFTFSVLLTPLRLICKFAHCVRRVPIYISSVRLQGATGHCGPNLLLWVSETCEIWGSRSGFAEGQDFCGAPLCPWVYCSLIFQGIFVPSSSGSRITIFRNVSKYSRDATT